MRPMTALAAGLAAIALAGPVLAVGMAPLAKQGMTVGPAKAFYLTVINPYAQAREFRAYVDGPADEATREDVSILPAVVTIKPGGQRRVVVIMRGLQPGETRDTRICAELAKMEGMVHARVCSKLSATRLAARS